MIDKINVQVEASKRGFYKFNTETQIDLMTKLLEQKLNEVIEELNKLKETK